MFEKGFCLNKFAAKYSISFAMIVFNQSKGIVLRKCDPRDYQPKLNWLVHLFKAIKQIFCLRNSNRCFEGNTYNDRTSAQSDKLVVLPSGRGDVVLGAAPD